MAERIVQEESLTLVADAIRAKGGTTDALSFPTGFANAISAIQAGGGGDESVLDALIERSATEISSNVKKIGNSAFRGCSKLAKANFPSATEIAGNAFDGCTILTEANFPLLTTESGSYDFNNCKSLVTTNFPLLTRIESYTFASCEKLKNVVFPKVTYINSSAFKNCYALETADFPLLTGTGNSVFQNCRSLTALILRSETRAYLGDASCFSGCYHILGTVNATYNPDGLKDGYIYVPSALLDSYKTATRWSTYADQFRALEDYTVDGTITGALDESKI